MQLLQPCSCSSSVTSIPARQVAAGHQAAAPPPIHSHGLFLSQRWLSCAAVSAVERRRASKSN